MTRKLRNFYDRSPSERDFLMNDTWCDYCQKADLGLDNPLEYEIDGKLFVEGVCKKCSKKVKTEVIEDLLNG